MQLLHIISFVIQIIILYKVWTWKCECPEESKATHLESEEVGKPIDLEDDGA